MEQTINNDNPSENLNDDEVIDLFIDGLMEEKGTAAPTAEVHQDIHDNLKNQLLTEIDRSIIAELPDDKLEELTRAAASEGELSPEVVAKAVEASNINVTEITGVTMQRFRDLYLNNANQQKTEE